MLVGEYAPGSPPPADSRAASEEMGKLLRDRMTDETLEAVERLRPIAASLELSVAQLALAWVLRREEVAAAIIGASRPEQVHDNAAASGVTLSADVVAAVEEALGEVPVRGQQLWSNAREGVLHR